MIMVTLLFGRVLSERALRPLLSIGDKIIAYRCFRFAELFSVIIAGNFTA